MIHHDVCYRSLRDAGCISCGCSRGHPCLSHTGSQRHLAELLERIAEALEVATRSPLIIEWHIPDQDDEAVAE